LSKKSYGLRCESPLLSSDVGSSKPQQYLSTLNALPLSHEDLANDATLTMLNGLTLP
jgi:hypothetical protein